MIREKEYCAYEGKKFEIEWYFDDKGKSPALDYYLGLTSIERMEVLKLFKRMGDAGEIRNKTKFRYEDKQIYAFKPMPDRFLCFFFKDGKVIVTNAFRKKQDKLPQNEHLRALKYKRDFEHRVKEGKYYD